MVALRAGDLSATQTAGYLDFDTLCSKSHCSTDCLLDRSSVRDTSLELAGNVFSNKSCVKVGLLDLHDVDGDRLAEHLFDFTLELFDFRTAAANDDAGLRAEHVDSDTFVITLDFNLRNTGCFQTVKKELSELVVFHKSRAEIFVICIPARFPVFDDADTKSGGVYFLSHVFSSSVGYSASLSTIVIWEVLLRMM